MKLINLREYLEFKMQDERRLREKTRFKIARTKDDPTLMFYIRSKYRSRLYKKMYTKETISVIYDKDGNPITSNNELGNNIVSFLDIKNDLDDLRIEETPDPSSTLFTKGDLLYTKSLYLSKINVAEHLRGQRIATRLASDVDKYSQVNGYEKIYGHGCAFGSTYSQNRTIKEEQYLKTVIQKYHLHGLSEDDKNLILFYLKKGYTIDGEISRTKDGFSYPFTFSKKVNPTQDISFSETLFLKDNPNRLDADNILLL